MIRRFAPLAIVLVLGLAFRFAVISQFHSSSPDGDQYFALSASLVTTQTFSYRYGDKPTWTRLPGYPLFLAAIELGQPSTTDDNLLRAAICNQLLDAATALLVFAIVGELLRGRRRARLYSTVAMAAVLLAPPLFLFASYRLTEPLTTFLTTLEIYCAVRAGRGPLRWWAALAGLTAGLGQLVRADAIAAAPALGLALFFAAASLRRRAQALALATAAWCATVAPWALRNLDRFDAIHLFAAEWPTLDGRALPTGMLAWMRTWAAGRPGDSNLASAVSFNVGIPLGALHRPMYDSSDERARLEEIISRYNRERLSPAVDEDFRALADERFRSAPLRWLVTLPARRFVELYRAPRRGDFPMRAGFLGLPTTRPAFDVWNLSVYLFALLGAAALWRRERKLLAVLAAAIGTRTLLHLWAVPPFVCQRYLVEVIPLFVALAACAPALMLDRAVSCAPPVDDA